MLLLKEKQHREQAVQFATHMQQQNNEVMKMMMSQMQQQTELQMMMLGGTKRTAEQVAQPNMLRDLQPVPPLSAPLGPLHWVIENHGPW